MKIISSNRKSAQEGFYQTRQVDLRRPSASNIEDIDSTRSSLPSRQFLRASRVASRREAAYDVAAKTSVPDSKTGEKP